MAGVTNYPFRAICREFGAGVYVSEMINARGFLEGNARTRLLASSRPDEAPRSVQIYGHDPVEVGAMARMLADEGVAHLDMNFGCPVPKVTRHGGGSAIPVKPKLLARIPQCHRVSRGTTLRLQMASGFWDSMTYCELRRGDPSTLWLLVVLGLVARVLIALVSWGTGDNVTVERYETPAA